ncbi:MAG: SDR family oxidoreductase, partial [Deltaproteobacteria bacterium]|nr:SDR family oxidoreductase [Deltaproteobacteria bacterium]
MTENNFSLKGKIALVTGGSKGIGREIALTFARSGADVAIAARGIENLNAAKVEIEKTGQRCVAISADLSLDKEIKRLHDTVTTELGHIDILVNNAGIGYFVALTDLTYNQFN